MVYLLLRADTSMFPSLMRSLINLLVRSSSISWHCSRSLNSGLSRKESLNSSVGRPIAKRMHTASYEMTKERRGDRLLGGINERKRCFNGLDVSSSSFSSCLSLLFPLRTSGPCTQRSGASGTDSPARLYDELYVASLAF